MVEQNLSADLEVAMRMADVADEITAAGFARRDDLIVTTKDDNSPVSNIDKQVERTLRSLVADLDSGSGFIGEEFFNAVSGDRRWIVDPVDQTRNYLRGIEIFATLIALEVDGEVVVGVVSAPCLRNRWWATKGGGAYQDGIPIQVSTTGLLSRSGGSIHAGAYLHSTRTERGHFEKLATESASLNSLGNFWAHMMVARGSLDWAISGGGEVWDYAAPSIVVAEAGGTFSDFSGRAGVDSGEALSSNGRLHSALTDRLAGR